VAQKELQQARKDNQTLAWYIDTKRRRPGRRRPERRWRRRPTRRWSSLLDISIVEVFWCCKYMLNN
jgi:hypothetical protein